MKFREKRGKEIDKKIIDILNKEERPISTREISIRAGYSWHTIINHCLKLQLKDKLIGYKISEINVWLLNKKGEK